MSNIIQVPPRERRRRLRRHDEEGNNDESGDDGNDTTVAASLPIPSTGRSTSTFKRRPWATTLPVLPVVIVILLLTSTCGGVAAFAPGSSSTRLSISTSSSSSPIQGQGLGHREPHGGLLQPRPFFKTTTRSASVEEGIHQERSAQKDNGPKVPAVGGTATNDVNGRSSTIPVPAAREPNNNNHNDDEKSSSTPFQQFYRLPKTAYRIYTSYVRQLWRDTNTNARTRIANDKVRASVRDLQHLLRQSDEYNYDNFDHRNSNNGEDEDSLIQAQRQLLRACDVMLAALPQEEEEENGDETLSENGKSLDLDATTMTRVSISDANSIASVTDQAAMETANGTPMTSNNESTQVALIPVAAATTTNKNDDDDDTTAVAPKKKQRSILFGAVMGAVVAAWVFSGNYIFTGVFCLMTILGQLEYYRMVMSTGVFPARRISVVGATSMFVTVRTILILLMMMLWLLFGFVDSEIDHGATEIDPSKPVLNISHTFCSYFLPKGALCARVASNLSSHVWTVGHDLEIDDETANCDHSRNCHHFYRYVLLGLRPVLLGPNSAFGRSDGTHPAVSLHIGHAHFSSRTPGRSCPVQLRPRPHYQGCRFHLLVVAQPGLF